MDVTVLGITFSPTEDLAKWRAEVGLGSDLLSDDTRAVAMAYGAATSADQAKAARRTFIIGADGRIDQIFEPQDVAGHAAQVLAALQP